MTSLARDARYSDFSPFNFQAPLAAGGVTLMAFNWLQFSVPHGDGLVRLSDIPWNSLATLQAGMYGLLVAIMGVLTPLNLLLTVVFLKDLVLWRVDGLGYREFMGGPPARVTGVFVPIASLAMTVAMLFASVPFFFPAVSTNIQALMVPGLVVFMTLWLTIFTIEARLFKSWLNQPVDVSKLNFVWLLDAFAFGLVGLAGTGLASTATSPEIASIAAVASLLAVGVGTLLLVGKLALLIHTQLTSGALPEYHLQPAFFLLVPITCLYGISYHKVMVYLQTWFELDVKVPSYFLINLSYGVAMGWAIFTVFLLGDYFRNYFRRSEYFPTQWAMV